MEDHASAALRHARDAEHLLEAGASHSPDQAWHLAGFAHECARKACLRDAWLARLLGHDFSGAGEQVIELAIALDPRAGRFPVRDWTTRHPLSRDWRADHRYERTGAAAQRDVAGLVAEARRAVDVVIVSLLTEGSLDGGSLR